jgi:NADH:ubiquinone reductase (H+-translocating)
MSQRVVIVGGGFAGISTALRLAKRKRSDIHITLISDKPHFEYHAALYRLVTGSSPLEVCIPLRDVFAGKSVDVVEDSIVTLRQDEKVVVGASGATYHYDTLVLALGSVTNHFGIPGLKEYSYGMKSVGEALRLKQHITEALLTCKVDFTNKIEQICDARFVVVGGGATGVEIAGNLIVYARQIASEYGLDPTLVSVELIEGAPKILPLLPHAFTDRIEHHLRGLGINIFLNHAIEREECEEVYLKDMHLRARTVIWTAGVRAHHAYESWGLPVDKRGKVTVDAHLRLPDDAAIFVAGDGAVTPYSGWAQTAMYDGQYIADVILRGDDGVVYRPTPPINAIPAGPGWAGVQFAFFGHTFMLYGKFGWWLRRLADFRVFWSILPLSKAWAVFREGASICETCSICSVEAPLVHTTTS